VRPLNLGDLASRYIRRVATALPQDYVDRRDRAGDARACRPNAWHVATLRRKPWVVLSLVVLALVLGWVVYEIWFGLTQAR